MHRNLQYIPLTVFKVCLSIIMVHIAVWLIITTDDTFFVLLRCTRTHKLHPLIPLTRMSHMSLSNSHFRAHSNPASTPLLSVLDFLTAPFGTENEYKH